MSKLPISALANQYPRGVAAAAVQGSTMNQLFNSMAQNQSTSGPHGSSHSTVVDNSISFCVQGVFMWLLLVWITAGTAAIVVLMVKNCRTRWKRIGDSNFDWGGLERIQPGGSSSSRSSSSLPGSVVISPLPIPPPPPPPLPQKFDEVHRSAHHPTGVRRPESTAVRPSCHQSHRTKTSHHRSRRLQSTQA